MPTTSDDLCRRASAILDRAPSGAGALVAELAGLAGDDFLGWLSKELCRVLEVDHALVGELCGDEWDRVRAIAFAAAEDAGGPAPSIEYACAGTPCERTVREGPTFLASGIPRLYPGVEPLASLGVEGYAGVPLVDGAGRTLGLLAVMSRRPLADRELVLGVMELFQARATAELERRRAVDELRLIIEGTTMPSSEGIFRSLVKALAHALHVRVAYVAELVLEPPGFARLLAMCHDGAIREDVENVEYELAGTPSAEVYERLLVFRPSGARARHPQDARLAEVAAEAYLGAALCDGEGRPIGHVAVIHDRELPEGVLQHSFFQVFAARAGAELQRRRAEARRLAVERKLLEAQKLESLGVLAGGIAHDFNNLLVGIMGNASLARLETPEVSPIRPYLDEIETASQRAADLARQMLAYSGKGGFLIRPIQLNELFEEMSHLLQVSIPKRIVLRYHLSEHLPPVRVDATQIRQIVMNLVLNAAEAIGERSGVIRLATGLVRATRAFLDDAAVGQDLAPGDYVYLEVTDTGCGMHPETRARIFDPFFTTKFTGRGLGLAAVQGIVRGHQAALLVRSEVGRGSTFQLLLPACDETAEAVRAEAEAGDAWRGHGRALVVDDEDTVRAAAARMLEALGFEVLMAETGAEAIELFRRAHASISVVLLDLTMPRKGGVEVFRELRAVQPDAAVILMSGYDEQVAVDPFADDGLAGFLQKPFRLEELRARVRAALGDG
jgi:signal transduction histidine kinase